MSAVALPARTPIRRPDAQAIAAMPHGDFSDVSALLFAVTGAASIFAPQLYFARASFLEIHQMLEIHPMFEAEPTPELLNARAAPHPSCTNPHPNPDLNNPDGQP